MVAAMPKNLQGMAKAFQENKITFADWRKELKGLPPEHANLLQQFASLQNRATGFSDILKSGGPAAQNYQDALRRVTGDATGLNVALMLTGENTDYVNGTLKTISGATTEAGNHVKGWSDVQHTFNQKLAEAKDSLGALGIKIGTVTGAELDPKTYRALIRLSINSTVKVPETTKPRPPRRRHWPVPGLWRRSPSPAPGMTRNRCPETAPEPPPALSRSPP